LLPEDSKFVTLFLNVVGSPHPESGKDGRGNVQAIVQLTDVVLAWKFTDESALLFAFPVRRASRFQV